MALPGFTDVTGIGVGRRAIVYRARPVGDNRFVAVKVFDLPDPPADLEPRWAGIADTVRPLADEPHLMRMHRAFVTDDGQPALALELCPYPLAALPRPDVDHALSVGAALGDALEAAHRLGLVHRRVTPGNVLVSEDGRLVLGDLGEAMLHAAGLLDPQLLDTAGVHVAPELLEGAPAGPATDVYGLASTLYELLAGHPAFRPYDGESAAAVSLRILRDPVPPIAGVPVRLSDLLLWGMAKEPHRRPPSAAIFGLYLSRVSAVG